MALRHRALYRFLAQNRPDVSNSCPTKRYLVIKNQAYGRTSNMMIELNHALWLSEQLNSTLVLPAYMTTELFSGFNTSLLRSRYCFLLDNESSSVSGEVIYIETVEVFYLFPLFHNPTYANYLPDMAVAVKELSWYFLNVYAGFWCCVAQHTLAAVHYIIDTHLHGDMLYASVHKRQLEGTCSSILTRTTAKSDFDPGEIALDHAAWQGAIHKNHPLCHMPYEFVQATMQLHHMNNSQLYVAHDGQHDVSGYLKHGAVFGHVLDNTVYHNVNRMQVDVLMCMHSALFVQNIKSTLSWQIYIIRLILSLPTVPALANDFFVRKLPEGLEIEKRVLWVSWYSTKQALLDHSN
ncbi:hypothetical protein EON65_41320 [archaeon]|nr:MAG: hypothetical protein EON65_41320 [archaeon]